MQPGTKVVCIDDDFSRVINRLNKAASGLTLIFPEKDKQYVIREVFDNEGIVDSVVLEEIWNPTFMIPVINKRRELAFRADRFAPMNDPIEETQEEEYSDAIKKLIEETIDV